MSKQLKMDNYWLKPVLTSNNFEGFEEVFEDINENPRVEKTVKPLPILVVRVNNIQPLNARKNRHWRI